MRQETTNILLVDDHNMIIEGMKAILEQIPNTKVVATASNAFEALTALKTCSISLAFIDINLPEITGIELCLKIKNEFPKVNIIGLSTFKQRSYVSQMIANGANGYLLKSATKAEIEQAIHDVMNGKMYFSTTINNNSPVPIIEEEIPILTRREKEILELIAQGFTNNQIGDKLFISHYTVETHRKNLLEKFEVGNTASLIRLAAGFGLL